MEVLNPTIQTRPQFFSTLPIYSPRYSITAWRKKNPYRLNILPRCQPFSSCAPLSVATKLRISAHFGRPTNRRNSLRKKLTEQQQLQQQQQQEVRHNPEVYDPGSDSPYPVYNYNNSARYYSSLDNVSVQESNFDSNYGVNEGNVNSDSVGEPKSKPLVESVLWNKLENWVDQYKNDSEFWGIGFSPIFTVFQNSEGNVKRVAVNEEEILRRSGIELTLYKQGEIEDFTEVNSKIARAKFIAREMEGGNYVIPKKSSVARFVVSGRQWGFANAIRGLNVRPGLSLKLPRIGVMVLCGFFVLWAMKKVLFTGGKDKAEYTRLEKEIMRRKMKARMEKDKLVKGKVEVIPNPMEQPMVCTERPRLNKQELMSSIVKANASSGRLELKESSSDQVISYDFDSKIQEIRTMARRAREIEKRQPSPGDIDGGDDLTVNDLSNQKEVVKQHGGVVRLPNDLSTEYSSQTRGVNEPLAPTSFSDLKSDDTGFSEEALVANNHTQRSSTSSMEVSTDGESTIQDGGGNLLGMKELSESSDTLRSQSIKQKKSFRTKPRVIRSVKEAKEFLSQKRDKQQPNQEPGDRTVPEGVSISTVESEKDNEVYGATILGGTSDFTPILNAYNDSVLKREESVSSQTNGTAAAGDVKRVTGLQMPIALAHKANIYNTKTGPSDIALPRKRVMDNKTSTRLDKDDKVFQPAILGGPSDSASAANGCDGSTPETTEESNHEDVGEGYCVDDVQKPPTSVPSPTKENWMEKNFHELEPVVKKIGGGFRDNYMVAREKVKQDLAIHSKMKQLNADEDDTEFDWMKDDRLREIVFQVRENELAGHDPFYLMDEEDKLTFFEGLEKKVEKENENLGNLHEWLHSNIENLDYGADGISLYDPLEKIIPRWKGPPVDKNPEFLNNFVEQRETVIGRNLNNSYIEPKDGQNSLPKSEESPSSKIILPTTSVHNQNTQILKGASSRPKTVIEGSDGSVRAGIKSGKEFWQHTKKWSREFLESYNAETDPEVKAVMKDIGKDLDRWITEKEIQEAADLMDKVPERGRKFIEKKLNKVKREMELFGPQAVVSKYREYAEEKEEDYLWWLDLPFVMCIELFTQENGEQKTGFYSLEMAEDLELDPKQYHVIACEDPGDCKNLCYIIQAHMEMLGNGNAFVVAQPPKDAFREAKANGFSVTVIRKRELTLNIDQTLEEVEEQIAEIGSKIYHDKIMREQSMDLSALTKGVLGASKYTKRRRSRRILKKPTK